MTSKHPHVTLELINDAISKVLEHGNFNVSDPALVRAISYLRSPHTIKTFNDSPLAENMDHYAGDMIVGFVYGVIKFEFDRN